MTLVGNAYIQDDDPGAVGYGYLWFHSNGSMKARNTDNTAWNSIGNTNLTNLGLVPKTGATMTGALPGVTGWAPLDSPNFTGTPKKLGVNLATSSEVSALQSTLLSLIDSRIEQAIATFGSKLSISGSMTFDSGVLDSSSSAQEIPLPVFAGDRQATEGECKWNAFPVFQRMHDSTVDSADEYVVFVDGGGTIVSPSTTRTLRLLYFRDGSPVYGGKFGYIIMAIKSF